MRSGPLARICSSSQPAATSAAQASEDSERVELTGPVGQLVTLLTGNALLNAMLAPLLGLTLLGEVSHRPASDPLMGLPFFACAALQAVALLLTFRFFRTQPAPRPA